MKINTIKKLKELFSINKVITRDGGKWWSKDHHLVVVKIVKNVALSLKNVKKW